MSDSEQNEPTQRVHKVVIRGTVEGYDVASMEDLNKIMNEIGLQHAEIETLKNQLSELQNTLTAVNSKLERIESFLKSFR